MIFRAPSSSRFPRWRRPNSSAPPTPLPSACGSIRYLSTATVVFAFPRDGDGHDLQGTGFVVPISEGLNITAAAWISSKWPQRAPEEHAFLRAFLGGARDPEVLDKSDAQLAQDGARRPDEHPPHPRPPILTRVYRWNRSSPQQEVGHSDLMKQIDAGLAAHPGLLVSAAGFRGVGIPDCIADARAAARGRGLCASDLQLTAAPWRRVHLE